MDVRRDYRITMALSWFKKNFPCDANGILAHLPGLELIVDEEHEGHLQRSMKERRESFTRPSIVLLVISFISTEEMANFF